jgi:hypothetical protein
VAAFQYQQSFPYRTPGHAQIVRHPEFLNSGVGAEAAGDDLAGKMLRDLLGEAGCRAKALLLRIVIGSGRHGDPSLDGTG